MGTITRWAKTGCWTSFSSGQIIDPAEVNTDLNTIYTEVNGLLDDGNVETATIPGAKSLRFTEMTAPSSPAANDAVLYSVDRSTTTTLEYKDSAGLVVSLGRMGARVRNSAAISLTSGVDTVLTFDTERFDRGGWHSTVSNTGRLTAPFACLCLIVGHVDFAVNATGERSLVIVLNATTQLAGITVAANAGTTANHFLTVSTIYALAATDYVQLNAVQVSGGALNVLATGAASPEFAIYCLGG